MMFWIMLPSNIFVLLIMHFTLKGVGKPNGNMILGVKIPTIYLNDERVQTIVRDFETRIRKLFWPFMLIQVIGYPIRQLVSLSLLWVYLYLAIVIGGYTYCIEFYSKKLKKLKKEEGWIRQQGHILNIDTEVSRLKNTFPVSRKHFLVPFALIGTFCFMQMEQVKSIVGAYVLITVFVVYLAGVLIYEIFVRTATVTYSENTEINIALNKAYKSAWSKFGVYMSYISLMFLPLIYMMSDENGYNEFTTIYTITVAFLSTVVSVIPMLMIHSKLQKLNTRLLQAEVEEYYIDDDEYWTAFTYNNPYDKKTWVNKRVGIGTTMNMATIGGKIFAYGAVAILVATILWSMWITVPIDFDTIEMEVKENYYEVGIWGDVYEIQKDEIISVQLLEELPSTYKTSGSSTSRMKTGTFSVKGYGQSMVYVMVKVPLYIEIELEDGTYVFINGEDMETTQEYYEMLKVAI